jgi:hypothetical protein
MIYHYPMLFHFTKFHSLTHFTFVLLCVSLCVIRYMLKDTMDFLLITLKKFT